MQEYERPVTVINQGLPAKATLKVIRLPESWYGVLWENENRYISFSQDKTNRNGGHAHMSDDEFLGRVQLVASFVQGVDFIFDTVEPTRKKKRRMRRTNTDVHDPA
ncbi:hypothetical protein G6K98_00055 [Agrobacterium rhizogenes]|nr:hypothetical protein [Rhizobium rhizogenes]NTH55891.1 hypothetical protein [Rhizobium rhizogenes]NTH87521.1 hypothetical protein [Rhizobium rhizogenes]